MSYLFLSVVAVVVGVVAGWQKYRKMKAPVNLLITLKNTGQKLMINLDDCEIKSREYYEEPESDKTPSRIEIMDSLYHPNRQATEVKKIVSVILYRHMDENGRLTEYRSEPLYLPLETLRFYLAEKKQTAIYIDSQHPARYYFDLEFLSH